MRESLAGESTCKKTGPLGFVSAVSTFVFNVFRKTSSR